MRIKPLPLLAPVHLETQDLLTYLAGVVVSVLTWLLILGWAPHLMIPGHDGTGLDLPYMGELARVNGEWTKLLYRGSWLGGMKMLEVTGLSWCLPFLTRLGFAPYAVLNGFVFFIQSIYAYLGIKGVSSLLTLWRAQPIILPWRLRLPLVWLFAFAPVIGWRLCYGHSTVAMASQFFISILTSLLAAMAGTSTVFLALISTWVAYTCFQSSMQQPILYAVVFGAPILLGLFWSEFQKEFVAASNEKLPLQFLLRRWLAILGKTFIPTVTGLLLALDTFSLVLLQSSSGDSARSVQSGSVTYSYLTGEMGDWLGSLLWTLDTFQSDRAEMMRHEVNYPLGPLLLVFILLFPWQKYWKVAVGLGVSLFLTIAFSNHVGWIADGLIGLIPPLNYFRVPTRSALVIAMTLPIYATASLLNACDLRRLQLGFREVLFCLGALAMLVSLPPVGREVLLWAGVLAVVGSYLFFEYRQYSQNKQNGQKWMVAPWCLILMLGVGSVLAFGERRLPFFDAEKTLAESAKIHDHLVAQVPELSSPLTRAYLNFVLPVFGNNTGMVLGISSISGYGFPLRRFLQVVAALEGVPYEPTTVNLNIPLDQPKFQILRQLYNVKYDLSVLPSQEIGVTAETNTMGPAWFVDTLEPVETFEGLVGKLQNSSQVKTTGFLIRDESAIPSGLLQWPHQPSCRDAQVVNVATDSAGQSLNFQLKTEADCPLIISTNYVSRWSAFLLENGIKKSLSVFPIDGALTGVLVPRGTSRLTLEYETKAPSWAQVGKCLGFILLGLMVYALGFMK